LLARLPKRQWARLFAPIAINQIVIPNDPEKNDPEKPFATNGICVAISLQAQ
jgi:hypothetical protein